MKINQSKEKWRQKKKMIKNTRTKNESERATETKEDHTRNEIMKPLRKNEKIICLKLY